MPDDEDTSSLNWYVLHMREVSIFYRHFSHATNTM